MTILNDPILLRQAENIETGRLGEQWVAAREKDKLSGTNYADQVDVEYALRASPFDIKSRTVDGHPLYIEVKATEGDADQEFFMTLNEYSFAENCMLKGIPYELHRVHHARDTQKRGEAVYTAEELICQFNATPASFTLQKKENPNEPEESDRGQEHSDYLPWEDCAERIPGTRCKFYLAKIEGYDPDFYFDRRFQRGKYDYEVDKIWLSCQIESTGVYEVSMLWLDENEHIRQRQRSWFMLLDGRAYDLEFHDVLQAVESLKKRST